MAVAALSSSAIALATVPAAQPTPVTSGPQTRETPDSFAKLVSRAKSDDQAPQGEIGTESVETESEIESETSDVGSDALTANGTSDTKITPTEKPLDLLGEIEAMLAAAGQLGITIPMRAPATIAIPTPVTAPATPVIATATATATAAPAITAVPLASQSIPSLPATTPSLAAPAPQSEPTIALPAALPENSAMMAAVPTAAPVAALTLVSAPTETAAILADIPISDAAPQPSGNEAPRDMKRDIASMLASLKAAFNPAEGKLVMPAAPIAPAETPAVAAALVLPIVPPTTVPIAVAAAAPEVDAAAKTAPVAPTVIRGAKAEPATIPGAAAAAIILPQPAKSAAPRPVLVASAESVAAPPSDSAVTGAVERAEPTATLPSSPALSPAPAVAPALTDAPVLQAAATIPADRTSTTVADTSSAVPSPADLSVGRHLDLARDTQWLDQLARDISQAATQQGHLKFQLNPEHLGALTVEIANSAAGTAIRLTADTDQARAIIADAQPRLLAEIRAQGLRVAESHVDLNQQGNGSSASAQGQQRQASEDHKPFARTQAMSRDDAGDSAPGDDGELYA